MAGQPSATKTTPGFGLKFLRDGMDSSNLVAMFSVEGQESWNFFANDFSNHIPASVDPNLQRVAKKFATATKWVAQVGLSDFSLYEQDGTPVAEPQFPYQLKFKPTLTLEDVFQEDFKDLLSEIPSGTHLYKVYGLDNPEEMSGKEYYIGTSSYRLPQ